MKKQFSALADKGYEFLDQEIPIYMTTGIKTYILLVFFGFLLGTVFPLFWIFNCLILIFYYSYGKEWGWVAFMGLALLYEIAQFYSYLLK